MNQFDISYTAKGSVKPTWVTSLLAKDAQEALTLATALYKKDHNDASGTFEISEDFV